MKEGIIFIKHRLKREERSLDTFYKNVAPIIGAKSKYKKKEEFIKIRIRLLKSLISEMEQIEGQ